MLDTDETIDAFRRSVLDIDCKHMVLAQHKSGGERIEGQGYIRQADGGALIFKIYVAEHNAKPFGHLEGMLSVGAGKLYGEQAFTISKRLATMTHAGPHGGFSRRCTGMPLI